ncbi:MAG: adenosylcobinamide-phosphate synthase CbiB [Alphaproteobacteria bacterium]|jgi:adenosylcobinamide-phosphate synthase
MLLDPTTGPLSLPGLLLAALLIDALVGDPKWLFRALPHPVALAGSLIGWFDRRLNRESRSESSRALRGLIVTVLVVALAAMIGWAIATLSAVWRHGWIVELVFVVLLVAQRSLFDHALAVAVALATGGVGGGRAAVAHIVGRDPEGLDAHGVARAAIESLAENFADGVVAPAFWYLLLGPVGIAAYKAANTLDSMIGHRTPRHGAFGRAAARLDDALNWLPARIAGAMIVIAALFTPGGTPTRAFRVMARDGGKHRSPNAGWPEAAMAGALSVALSGPRSYAGLAASEPWLGEEYSARIGPVEIRRALYLFAVACLVNAAVVAAIAWYALAV